MESAVNWHYRVITVRQTFRILVPDSTIGRKPHWPHISCHHFPRLCLENLSKAGCWWYKIGGLDPLGWKQIICTSHSMWCSTHSFHYGERSSLCFVIIWRSFPTRRRQLRTVLTNAASSSSSEVFLQSQEMAEWGSACGGGDARWW